MTGCGEFVVMCSKYLVQLRPREGAEAVPVAPPHAHPGPVRARSPKYAARRRAAAGAGGGDRGDAAHPHGRAAAGAGAGGGGGGGAAAEGAQGGCGRQAQGDDGGPGGSTRGAHSAGETTPFALQSAPSALGRLHLTKPPPPRLNRPPRATLIRPLALPSSAPSRYPRPPPRATLVRPTWCASCV
eukprot:1176076-Prorocentrum_minimum.AAC.5